MKQKKRDLHIKNKQKHKRIFYYIYLFVWYTLEMCDTK